jgi:hypothetical protein
VLPDHGAEAKGNELQQPLGDRGAQDKGLVSLPTGRDGAEVLGRRSLPVAIRFGAPGMSRQFFAPEAKAKGPRFLSMGTRKAKSSVPTGG